MNTQTMSVTRALVELKRLDDKINRAATQMFLSRTQGANNFLRVPGSSETSAQVTEKIRANFNSVSDLINQRQRIKSAVVKSNAVTVVTLGTMVMTVAEAIEMKSSVEYKENLLAQLRRQFLTEKSAVDKANLAVEDEINKLIQVSLGGDKSKASEEGFKTISDSIRAQKENKLLDPIGIENKIKQLEEEVSLVKTELDFVLSESNAVTQITI